MKQVNAFRRDGSNLFHLSIYEHTGTHVDAPLHFSADGASLSELDPQKLLCPLCVIDISAKARDEVNAMVSREDVERWISTHGDIPEGACVAMNSGWGAKAPHESFRNTPDGKLAFPGFSKAATDLLAERSVWPASPSTRCRSTPATPRISRFTMPGLAADASASSAWRTSTSCRRRGPRSSSARPSIAAAPAARRASSLLCKAPGNACRRTEHDQHGHVTGRREKTVFAFIHAQAVRRIVSISEWRGRQPSVCCAREASATSVGGSPPAVDQCEQVRHGRRLPPLRRSVEDRHAVTGPEIEGIKATPPARGDRAP